MIITVIIRVFAPQVIPIAIFWILTIWSPKVSAIIVSGLIISWVEIKKLLGGFLRWKVRINGMSLVFFLSYLHQKNLSDNKYWL